MSILGCTTAMFRGDLKEKLTAMREAGFTHTELMSRDIFESLKGIEYTLAMLKDSGMKVSCLQLVRDFEGSPREEMGRRLKHVEHVLEHASFVEAPTLILCANTAKNSVGDIQTVCGDLRRLGDLAASRGLRIAYEPLAWATWFGDYRDAWRLVEQVDHPAFGIMLDSSHIGSLNLPYDFIRSIDVSKIFLVEVADLPITRLENLEQSLFYRLFPGEGMLELESFVTALDHIGYDGVYSLEVFNDHLRQLDPRLVAKQAHASLTSLLTRSRTG